MPADFRRKLKEHFQPREEARKNIVEMRGKWKQGSVRRALLTIALIVITVVLSLMTRLGDPVTDTAFGVLNVSESNVPMRTADVATV